MKVVWSPQADRDRDEILDYIASDNPEAALSLDAQIEDTVQRIERFPFSARAGRVQGTREAVIGSYILVYKVMRDQIDIAQIVHGARQYPHSRHRN